MKTQIRSLVLMLLVLFCGIFSASTALAREEEKGPPKPEEMFVQLAAVGLPAIYQGRVENYVFVIIRVELTPKADLVRLRSKEPYFRDALVRLAHREPLNPSNDTSKLDEARFKALFLKEVETITGKGMVKGITIISQTPRRQTGLVH